MNRSSGILLPISSLPLLPMGLEPLVRLRMRLLTSYMKQGKSTGSCCHLDQPVMEILHIRVSLHLQEILIL